MTVQVVPTDATGLTNYSQTTVLEGTAYLLTFSYNQRENCWYLSMATEEGDDIIDGMKLVCSWPITRKCADPRAPQGELMVISNTSDNSPPGLADLAPGGRCILNYFTSDLIP